MSIIVRGLLRNRLQEPIPIFPKGILVRSKYRRAWFNRFSESLGPYREFIHDHLFNESYNFETETIRLDVWVQIGDTEIRKVGIGIKEYSFKPSDPIIIFIGKERVLISSPKEETQIIHKSCLLLYLDKNSLKIIQK